ncbi:hypothetical protein HYQ45_006141 [Verticillium longisporum]|uniref:Uncharacterized protein n=1 Tax=Verticillium longisporum TaxID=100787 RepID=A0A8I3ASY3_VERLO|nr:hypothetical protein HYQ45_006141 [Verticillium longisporum]RBQ78772.1 hypothetical protein VDGD_21204 [Verticillium dahliae]
MASFPFHCPFDWEMRSPHDAAPCNPKNSREHPSSLVHRAASAMDPQHQHIAAAIDQSSDAPTTQRDDSLRHVQDQRHLNPENGHICLAKQTREQLAAKPIVRKGRGL